MTIRSEHVAFETLNDFVDGRLSAIESKGVESHLATCPDCSSEHSQLTGLLARTGHLPREVLPADDVWGDIRQVLNERKEVVLPVRLNQEPGRQTGTHRLANPWIRRAPLAAAAVVLVVASSWITRLAISSTSPHVGSIGSAPTNVTNQSVLPASLRQTEREYSATIEQLKTVVDAERGRLSPETVRTVDRSLAVIDSAIAEARSALIADPGSSVLVDLLSASYQRKLDLLRRTSELGSRI